MGWHEGRTEKIVVDPGSALKLRRELGDMGIRHATVYGDLQSVPFDPLRLQYRIILTALLHGLFKSAFSVV